MYAYVDVRMIQINTSQNNLLVCMCTSNSLELMNLVDGGGLSQFLAFVASALPLFS